MKNIPLSALIGLFFTGLFFLMAIFAPFVAPYGMAEIVSETGWEQAANGIMTTDTRPKAFSREISLSGGKVVITGIAKGAGMIRPDMATMLAYIATDALIPQPDMSALLSDCVSGSFNAITIDGDTSTNDACCLIASGASGIAPLEKIEDEKSFKTELEALFFDLARELIKDGEGATKLVYVSVGGAMSVDEAAEVAYVVAQSPLVKTALFASDANWGRILAAIGRANVANLDVSGVSVSLGDVLIAERGGRAASYTDAAGQVEIEKDEVTIAIDLGRGDASSTVLTSDLSHDYIRINAEYRS